MPNLSDPEKGGELPYICADCGYEGVAGIKVTGIDPLTGALQAELIPQGLIGIVGVD